jgi:hypothetical protein
MASVSGDRVEPAIYAANIEMGDCWVPVYLDRQHGAFSWHNPELGWRYSATRARPSLNLRTTTTMMIRRPTTQALDANDPSGTSLNSCSGAASTGQRLLGVSYALMGVFLNAERGNEIRGESHAARIRCYTYSYGLLASAAALVSIRFVSGADARITRIDLGPPTSPFGNTSFGSVGQYEQIDGTAYGEVDPRNPLNAVIQDIELAPRNARGKVEYSTKVSILKPVDESRGNQTILFEIVNRGNKLDPGTFNVGVTTANPAGDGFLENQGFTLLWAGWQADLVSPAGVNLVTMSAPIAHYRNGATITGVVRSEFIINTTPQSTQNILAASSSNTPGYPTVSLDNSHDTLTMRVHQDDPKVPIPNSGWAYADCTSAPFPGVPDPQKVCLKNGFDTNHIYELIYTARDPIVMGLGLAAIRDVAAFFHDGRKDDQGNRNPLAGDLKYTLLNGISQSGRLLRTYLALGFNEGEDHEQVFDGMHPHIGSVRNYINVRFSQPGRPAGTQHTEKQYPGPESPLTYGVTQDPLAGETEDLFDRCRRTHTCPNIVHTMSDIEYWEASGAGDTTDPAGRLDVHIPDNVRIFEFSRTQHGGFSPVAALPTSTGICQQLPNANSYTYNIRALLVALQQWGRGGPGAACQPVFEDRAPQPGATRSSRISGHSQRDWPGRRLQHPVPLQPRPEVRH